MRLLDELKAEHDLIEKVLGSLRTFVDLRVRGEGDAADARAAARTAQELAQDASAKSVLLDARVSEAAMQRSQVEELLQSVARSRDENVVADVEAACRR